MSTPPRTGLSPTPHIPDQNPLETTPSDQNPKSQAESNENAVFTSISKRTEMKEIDCYPTAFHTPRKCNLYEADMQLEANDRVEGLVRESHCRLERLAELSQNMSGAKTGARSRLPEKNVEHGDDFDEMGSVRNHTLFKAIKAMRNHRLLNGSSNKGVNLGEESLKQESSRL
jgi:hypothetical protein